jgi:hypothetical protein
LYGNVEIHIFKIITDGFPIIFFIKNFIKINTRNLLRLGFFTMCTSYQKSLGPGTYFIKFFDVKICGSTITSFYSHEYRKPFNLIVVFVTYKSLVICSKTILLIKINSFLFQQKIISGFKYKIV